MENIRLDVGAVKAELGEVKDATGSIQVTLAGLGAKMDAVGEKVTELKGDSVTRAELSPVRRLVYGAAGIILSGVLLLGLAKAWPALAAVLR